MEAEKKFVPQKWSLYAGGPDHSKRWFIYAIGPDGKRVRDYAGLGRIQDMAQRRATAERLIAERNGTALPAQGEGLSDFAQQWLTLNQTRSARSNTNRRSIAGLWEKFLREKGVWYGSLTPEIAAEWLRTRQSGYAFVAKALTRRAIKTGMLTTNPFEGLKRSYHHTPATLIPPARVQPVLAELKKRVPRVWMMCLLEYYTFIRPMEQLRLAIGDLRIEEGMIVIPGAKAKNGRTAKVVIPAPLVDPLREYLETECANNTYLFERAEGIPFTSPTTFRLHHQAITAPLRLAPGTNLYSWKHTGAVAAARAGVPLKQLQMQLRHASLDQVNEYLRQMGVEDMGAVAKGW